MTFKQKLLSLLAIAFCFFYPHIGGNILVYPVIVTVVIFLYLRFVTKENFKDLLFSFKRFEFRSVWIGIAGAILLSAFFRYAWDPVVNFILPAGKIDLSDFDSIRGNTWNYIFILVIALIVGGFYEELIFHGFIFTRFEKMFPGKYGTAIAFVLTTIIFGAYHFQQGIRGVLLTTIAGAVYHWLVLRYRRNLWYGIFIHTFFDFIGLTMIYLGVL